MQSLRHIYETTRQAETTEGGLGWKKKKLKAEEKKKEDDNNMVRECACGLTISEDADLKRAGAYP